MCNFKIVWLSGRNKKVTIEILNVGLYVHMKVHRNKFLYKKNQQDARISQILFCQKNSTCFVHFSILVYKFLI